MSIGDSIEQRGGVILERRDPTAATQQVHYLGAGNPQIAEWDAAQAVRLGYLANVIAYRCIQIKARTIASLPIRCGPDPTDRTRINPGSPLARLLGPPPQGPAPKLSARKLIAWSIAQKLVTGRYAWELELDDQGVPQYFWPLVCENLKAIPTDSGSEWFRAFTYGRPDKPTKLTPEQVFYDWNPSQLDFRQPESALQAARYDLSIAVMGDRYSHAFLKNGSVPAAMVVTTQPPTPEAQERFERRWTADYQGPDKAGTTGFQYVSPGDDGDVSKLLDVKVLGLPQKDSQFVEQHRASLEMIAIALGVPWSKLDASGRTFDNAGHEDRTWWHDSMLPDIVDLEDQINLELAPRLGNDLMWFDLSGVEALRAPDDFTVVDGIAMYDRQLATGDEVRKVMKLPPIDAGLASQMLAGPTPSPAQATPPISAAGTVAAPDPEVRTSEDPAEPTDDEVRQAEEDRAAAIESRRARIWKKADAQVRTLEKRWERAMARMFTRQAKSVDQALRGKRGHKLLVRAPGDPSPQIDPAAIFNPQYWTDETAAVTTDLYESVTSHGFARVSDIFGVSFDLEAPYAQEFVQSRANQLAGQVTDTTYRQIQDVLSAAVENGDDIEQIAADVAAVFDAATASRAVTIARTEVISAFNGSASLAAGQLPEDVVGGQEWIATRDGRTRDTHAAADGQVTAIGEPFNVGGAELAYPGDPFGDAAETINCRCTEAFLTPDEIAARAGMVERRVVSLTSARLALRFCRVGEFDESEFRSALREAAA